MTRHCIGRGKQKQEEPKSSQPQIEDKTIIPAAVVSNIQHRDAEIKEKKKAEHNKSSLSYYARNKQKVLDQLHKKRAALAEAKRLKAAAAAPKAADSNTDKSDAQPSQSPTESPQPAQNAQDTPSKKYRSPTDK
jgi:hypothetical protein